MIVRMQCQVDKANEKNPEATSAHSHQLRAKFAARLYLPATLVAFILTLFVLEWFLFPLLEDKRVFWGAAWQEDEKKLFKLSCLRNWASQAEPLFRNALVFPRKVKTGKRLLVMGDSFVWGDGYRNINDIWWRQLDRELVRRGYRDIEVLAAGYPGYSTGYETRAAERLVRELRPDMIIWGYTENDADEGLIKQNIGQGNRKLPGSLRQCLPNFSCFVERQMLDSWNGFDFTAGEESASAHRAWEAKLLEGENFQRFSANVQRMGGLLKAAAIPGFVITLPKVADETYYAQYFQPVKPVFEGAGVPFVDTSHDIKAWYGSALVDVLTENPLSVIKPASFLQISPANSHPSAALTKFYAVACADYLESHYGQFLGPKTSTITSPEKQNTKVEVNDCLPIFTSYRETTSGITFEFPAEALLPTMPGRKPYVLFNFKEPVALSRITLSGGPAMKKAYLAVSYINGKLGFDTAGTIDAQSDAGGLCQVKGDKKILVNSVRVSADFQSQNPQDRELKLSF